MGRLVGEHNLMGYTGMPCGFQKRDFPTTKAQRKVSDISPTVPKDKSEN